MTQAIPSVDQLAGAHVLVVDDEPGMRHFLTKIVGPRVKRLEEASSPKEASAKLDEGQFDIVILDNVMPGGSGLDWVSEQRRKGFFGDTILITAYADLETAIAALRAGVSDFVLKPFRTNQILDAMSRTLDRTTLRRDNTILRHALSAGQTRGPLIGRSPRMAAVRDILDRLAPLPTPVLFTGATGTGKELGAWHLHLRSPKAGKPFVAVNCATVPPDRMTQELFGRIDETGTLHPGFFLLADGGTLFLDEIGQMSEPFQAALLRVLEDKRVRPAGAQREIPVDIRLSFATNTDLPALVEAGRFREDLYHRINVVQVAMPQLSARAEDVVELAAYFMEQHSGALGLPALPLDDETLMNLRRYPWPGNVRELKNLIERSLILGAYPPEFAGRGELAGAPAIENLEQVVQRHILHVLEECGGNRAEAARRLGVSRKTVDRKVSAWVD